MSLPSTSSKPSQQPSIRSFFRSETPKYATPPSSSSSKFTPGSGSASGEVATSSTTTTTQPLTSQAASPPPTTRSTVTTGPKATPLSERHLPALPSHLPPEADIRPLSSDDIPPLKRLNALLLPVAYQEPFYTQAVEAPFSRVITWQHAGSPPKVVGAVVCRLESEPAARLFPPQEAEEQQQERQKLYIRSLCLLSPYRGFGLVSAALENIEGEATADKNVDVRAVTAHVWTENEDGLRWYDSRGFKKVGAPIQRYYAKLRPDSAYLVSKDVGASVRAALETAARSRAPGSSEGQGNGTETTNEDGESKRPGPPGHGQSYQTQKTETEWNDLPADMAPGVKAIRKGSEPGSAASSRSSSAARKKRDRSYPAAAFGAS